VRKEAREEEARDRRFGPGCSPETVAPSEEKTRRSDRSVELDQCARLVSACRTTAWAMLSFR
jgi:hypothetical protein